MNSNMYQVLVKLPLLRRPSLIAKLNRKLCSKLISWTLLNLTCIFYYGRVLPGTQLHMSLFKCERNSSSHQKRCRRDFHEFQHNCTFLGTKHREVEALKSYALPRETWARSSHIICNILGCGAWDKENRIKQRRHTQNKLLQI